MEDFCQLDGRLTEDKYRGSYERCGKIISEYSELKGLDHTELFIRIVFSFAVGNSDMHLKNFSLIETAENSNKYILSAAYDMLSTNVVIPTDKEELALTINGKKQNIRRKDFIKFAETIGIAEKTADKMIEKIVKLKDKYIAMCRESYMPDDMKEALKNLIENRIAILQK
jgi:serine/threonine-protein kinase HipA